MKKILTLLGIILILNNASAQSWPADTIKININSNNPAFPFPQFLEYNQGKTLGKYNAEGVTHADMEKAMREAYQIMMHRCIYSGKVLNGKRYIIYNASVVPENNNTFVSEGDGYALLAAAYFADKEAFDGLWLWVHDNRLSKVKRYDNCADLRPTYRYGPNLPGWKNDQTTPVNDGDNDSATDGDYDIAMALLIAFKQWGANMGINDACGNPISYQVEARKMINAIVDTIPLLNLGAGALTGYLSGDIGVDGYCKNGNTWDEITSWRYNAANQIFPNSHLKPEAFSQSLLYTDYIGPAYFNQFAKYLAANGGTPWQINQYLRGEASSDWLIGQMYAKGYVASSGNCTVNNNGTVTTFGPHPKEPQGEDFRAAWRTILNYVWHGNPTTRWNPVTHQVENIPNTYERDMALRHALYLKGPGKPIGTPQCNQYGSSPDPACPLYKGVANIPQAIGVDGTIASQFRTNYNVGTGAPAAVASEDLELIAEMYRQAEIMWDDASKKSTGLTERQRYIGSTPIYFHDWFRTLGMLTNSGNLHPPTTINALANVKSYLSVDRTYAYAGDFLTYTIDYRNYGSITALNTLVTATLSTDYEFVSATNGGTLAGNTISWNIGSLPGFTSAGGIAPTTGKVQFIVKVVANPVSNRVCLLTTITASNNYFDSKNTKIWTSNEYPNNATYTMERNCVDILLDRTLTIKKTSNRRKMNPGDITDFKLEFENKSSSNAWLNGGRDKVVLSYGNHYPNNGYTFYQFYRLWHGAEEAYINMKNYRVSYFMNDAAALGLYDATTNPTGWDFSVDNQSDLNKYGYNPASGPITFNYQAIPAGSDANGSWNQRLVIRFADVLTSPATHIFDKLDNQYLIHKGVLGPGFIRTKLESKPSSMLGVRLADDWSYSNTIDVNQIAAQNVRLSPVSNSWAKYTNLNVAVNNYGKDVCNPDVPNFKKVLVEEFDGYTWRRILGNGPLPGREAYNVVVYDTIPKWLTWNGFTDNIALGVTATYTAAAVGASYTGVVKWEIPTMLIGEKGDLSYQTIAKNPPCPSPDIDFVNVGWIKSLTDSPDSSQVPLTITCNPIPPLPPVETSLFKTADKKDVSIGDIITYTLKFKNKDGATVNGVFGSGAVTADWQKLGNGFIPILTNSAISFDPNTPGNPNPGSIGYAFGHKKSHGKNGYMEAVFDLSNASDINLIFRHTAGTPGQSDFNGVRLRITPNPMGNNTMNLQLFNNTNSIISENNISYGGSPDPITVRAELIDDKIYFWVNTLSGTPLKVYSGITNMAAGYVGLFSNSQQRMTSYKTKFDSAFDIILTDPVPGDLNNVTAISNGGVLSAGTITWPTLAGPMLGNDSITRTFKATVNQCTNFITNIGNASIYGLANIKSQYVVNCLGALPLDFINFQVSTKNLINNLTWTVAGEEGGYYEVLNGDDVNNLQVVGNMPAQNKTEYHYAHAEVITKPYYQIKYVADGVNTYSKKVNVNSKLGNISIIPNPFNNYATVYLANIEEGLILVHDQTGKLVEKKTINEEKVLLGENLRAGVYMLTVISNDQLQHFKLVKE